MDMYKQGDIVLYGTEGICRIEDISVLNMYNADVEYYVLRPLNGWEDTIFVPTDSQVLVAKMRRVMAPEEIYALIRTMPEEESEWIENENERKARYKEILADGDRRNLVRMIKAIHFHAEARSKAGKKLHLSDERFLKEGEKLLYEEFAHVLKIAPDEVLPFIMEQISVSERE